MGMERLPQRGDGSDDLRRSRKRPSISYLPGILLACGAAWLRA